jgi:PPK2 family polyphosphate:nucleotide phosphotransferase
MSKKPAQSLGDRLKPFVAPFRFDGSGEFHLRAHRTNERGGLDKDKAEKILEANRKRLSDFQEKLYAQDRWSVLIILQGMDAAGKDSAIKNIFAGVNPQGCEVTSFKQPTSHELAHDFMWRAAIALPARGRIGIFNRSYYEECLVTRVHRELLAKEMLPSKLVTKNIWRERFEDICAFEHYLARNGTVILKFFLHLSKEEQRQRFLGRLEEPSKNWKFSMADVAERALWPRYMARGAGRPQMVRARGDRIRDRQCAGRPQSALSAYRQGLAAGIRKSARGAETGGQGPGKSSAKEGCKESRSEKAGQEVTLVRFFVMPAKAHWSRLGARSPSPRNHPASPRRTHIFLS